jgi:DNA-binding IclR family transcriptional regulator
MAGEHRTINRVTHILEEVVYRPGQTYSDLTKTLEAPKSSVYGFVQGLLAADWLIEDDHRLYLGPAFYGLAIASGHIRAGVVSAADLETLHRDTGLGAYLGVRAGASLIYIAEAGSDLIASFRARSNIRRPILRTAGGKVLLAALPEAELDSFLRSRSKGEQDDVHAFLEMVSSIRETEIAVNVAEAGSRAGVATLLRSASGQPVASVTLVGPSAQVLPQIDSLGAQLRKRVREWQAASNGAAREPL